VKRFPAEFSDLLSRKGHAVLHGGHALCGSLSKGRGRFFGDEGLFDARAAKAVAGLLDRALGEFLVPMEQPIPAAATWGMKVAYTERLPKTVRVKTAMLDDAKSKSYRRAGDIGLLAFLRSQSLHAFAEALSGYPLRKKWGLQALCYGPGDYSGPHNDHHPDEPLGRDGYTDLHLTFCSTGVEHQWLVYEHEGHLSSMRSIATVGGVTCYRLPFWHYTTPLVAKPRRDADARRWVLLGTFLDRWS
jgi:hypothetical protein